MTGGKAPRLRGDRFERACVARLKTAGYYVIRSAGSHGAADLVAFRSDRLPAFISCKVTDNTTTRQRAAFYRTAEDAGALAVLATRPANGRGITWQRVNPEGARHAWQI
jgi:Holliday junction resolvase